MAMRIKIFFILPTIALFVAVCAKGDALARGGGGGKGAHGTMSGWHGATGHGTHRMNGHGAHFSFKGQHPHGLHNSGGNQHQHMMAQGQWHSAAGFGMHGHNGEWHRNWQTGGGGAFVGDICLNAQNCQGVWQVTPRTSGAAAQSRGVKKDWQVDGEL